VAFAPGVTIKVAPETVSWTDTAEDPETVYTVSRPVFQSPPLSGGDVGFLLSLEQDPRTADRVIVLNTAITQKARMPIDLSSVNDAIGNDLHSEIIRRRQIRHVIIIEWKIISGV
jgi:hypothetical protein